MPSNPKRGAYSRDVAAQHAAAGRRRVRRRRVWPGIAVAAVLLIAFGATAAWIGSRALTVKDELAASEMLYKSADGSLTTKIDDIGAHAMRAAAAADDPLWRAAEYVPFAGDNLRAVRLAAESLNAVVNDLGKPVLALKDSPSTEPVLARVTPVLASSAPKVTALARELHEAAASQNLIGPVRSGVDQVDSVMSAASPVLRVLPKLLGAEGPKNYLLVFQNNAEALALGGSAASQTLVHVENGKISIAKQGNSQTYKNGQAVDVRVDQSAIDLYGTYLVDHVNTTMARPDFPTGAQLIRAFWQRDVDPAPVDAVVSIDPIALAKVLGATGPVTTATGDTLTSQNAVKMLLSDVYARWDSYREPGKVDAYFASIADAVFAKVSAGGWDIKTMVAAINDGIEGGDILMWSDDPDVAAIIKGQRISGVLPRDNKNATTLGVFFRDTSASKIDYYMKSSIAAKVTCTGNAYEFTMTAGLHLDIAQKAANALPLYVKSFTWGAKKFRTEVQVYGPPGTTFKAVSVDGADVRPVTTSAADLGRPVVVFETYLKPGQKAHVTATFTGAGTFGPLEIRSTPMVNKTMVTVSDSCR